MAIWMAKQIEKDSIVKIVQGQLILMWYPLKCRNASQLSIYPSLTVKNISECKS